ncbi:MAG: hypothetical protein DRH79_05980 [Candidatus Cloacimonadota bacterium]|nr:MAG: hypothetical protein DRH79_05980 [Candidatus Cloacimonadota bacterium]
MIPIGDETWEINPSAENQSGLGIFVLDDNTPDPHGFDGWWPLDNTDLFDPENFGTITYGVIPEIPPAPENVELVEIIDETLLELSWDMPTINDLDHFNIYLSIESGAFELFNETVGTAFYYPYVINESHAFYITTVSQQGMESEPSEIVEWMIVDSENLPTPLVTKLNGNYPNPFNPSTNIAYSIKESGKVTLQVYNIRGQLIKTLIDEVNEPGEHAVTWNGKNIANKSVASGIYFYKLKTDDFQQTKKMIMLK